MIDLVDQAFNQIPSIDNAFLSLMEDLNEGWWQLEPACKIRQLSPQLYQDRLIAFLNRHDPRDFSDATIQGLNFYALVGQNKQIPTEIEALNAKAAQFAVLTQRISLFKDSPLQEKALFLYALSPAFFQAPNVSLLKQLTPALCQIEQAPYLNRFLEMNPSLTPTHILHMNAFAEKFKGIGIPQDETTLSIAVTLTPSIFTDHERVRAAPPLLSQEALVEPLDPMQLIHAQIHELNKALNQLVSTSDSSKSIIGRVVFYATPHWYHVRALREMQLRDSMNAYQGIMTLISRHVASLAHLVHHEVDAGNERHRSEIRSAIEALGQRLLHTVITPLQTPKIGGLEALIAAAQAQFEQLNNLNPKAPGSAEAAVPRRSIG